MLLALVIVNLARNVSNMGKLSVSDKLNVIDECKFDKQANEARKFGVSRVSSFYLKIQPQSCSPWTLE